MYSHLFISILTVDAFYEFFIIFKQNVTCQKDIYYNSKKYEIPGSHDQPYSRDDHLHAQNHLMHYLPFPFYYSHFHPPLKFLHHPYIIYKTCKKCYTTCCTKSIFAMFRPNFTKNYQNICLKVYWKVNYIDLESI